MKGTHVQEVLLRDATGGVRACKSCGKPLRILRVEEEDNARDGELDLRHARARKHNLEPARDLVVG